jgi:hypothetical protein
MQGGNMASKRRWIGLLAVIPMLSVFLIIGCSDKKSEEKLAEDMTKKFLKEATGKDIDVKMQKGKVEIDEKGGSKTVIAESTTWPSDMFKEVPQFTSGKIQHVVKSDEQGDIRKFNIHYTDLDSEGLNKYAEILKKNGWQTNVMQVGEKGSMLSAQLGKLAIQFSFEAKQKKGILVVFNMP